MLKEMTLVRHLGLRRLSAAIALAGLALLAGCSHKSRAKDAGAQAEDAGSHPAAPLSAPRLTVGQVVVGTVLGWDRSLDAIAPDEVRTLTETALAGTELMQAGGSPASLKVRIGAGHGDGDATTVRVAVQLTMTWQEGGEERTLESRVLGERAGGDGNALVKTTLPRAITDATTRLVRKDDIRRGDAKLVIAALDDADPAVRTEALRAIAERKLHAAVPRLVTMLDDEDSDRADEALGALVALKEESAVKLIVDRVQFSDIDGMRRVIDAVAQIGGAEAESYLEFVASGHDLPGVRDLAADALRRLRARKSK
jgi:hypothetical protein